jgi:hypothetical protein
MGVVHRDLKPENIMLGKPGEDGQPVTKLLDLGIAKMREVAGAEASGTTALTVAGQVLGTPFYMSPEQWGEVPHDGNMEIDGRADIYSLGCVFYELLVGRRAFGGLTLQELRREHVTLAAQPLHEINGNVSEAFSRAIARAMSKDRGQRQATAGELANELRVALGQAPLSSSQLNYSAEGASVPGSSPSYTAVENPDARKTNADVISPTIMTLDSPPQPQASPPAPPPMATSLAQQEPLDATSLSQPPAPSVAAYNSGYATAPPPNAYSQPNAYNPAYSAPQPPSYSMPAAPAAPARSKSMLIVAIVMGVVLLAAGVGGLLLWRSKNAKTDEPKVANGGNKPDTPNANKENGSTTGGTTGTASAKESLTYWLEVQMAGAPSARVAGVVPLASGQSFKLHFTPRENGYLYIIVPGEKNVPTAFLTTKPYPPSGITSNEVKSGVDFSFPNGNGNWITLDKTPGTENYTIIFSPTLLASPSFLNAAAPHPLTASEQKELTDFKAQFNANAPTVNVINGSGVDPLVSIKIPQAKPSGEPVIFDMRIEHK